MNEQKKTMDTKNPSVTTQNTDSKKSNDSKNQKM
jgi:hypothetical protein